MTRAYSKRRSDTEVAIDLLKYLKKHGSTPPTMLCRKVFIRYGRLTALLAHLWSSRLIIPVDATIVSVTYSITPKGKKALKTYEALRRKLVSDKELSA